MSIPNLGIRQQFLQHTPKALEDIKFFHHLALPLLDNALFRKEFVVPPFHWQIYDLLLDQSKDLNRMLISAPVGFSKSTLGKIATAYMILTRQVTHALYVSSTSDKIEVLLSNDKPEGMFKIFMAVHVQDLYQFKVLKCNTTELVIEFADGKRAQIIGKSALTDIGSLRFPWIMIDDIEDLLQARSKTQTDNLQEWFQMQLLSRTPTAATGFVRMINTVLTKDSLTNRILQNAKDERGAQPWQDWYKRLYQAIIKVNDTEQSLWESRHPLADLQRQRQINPFAFAANYMGEPMDNMQGVINLSMLQYYNPAELYDLQNKPIIKKAFAHFDLASTNKKTSDFFAGIVLGQDQNNFLYILDIINVREEDALKQAEIVVNTWLKWQWCNLEQISFESVQYQSVLKNLVEHVSRQRGTYMSIKPINASISKELHFSKHVPIFTTKAVKLPVGHIWLNEFEQQIINFPRHIHDDLVDAFAGAADNFNLFADPNSKGLHFSQTDLVEKALIDSGYYEDTGTFYNQDTENFYV